MGARRTIEGAGLAFLRALPTTTGECIEYPHGRFTTGYGRIRIGARSRPAHVVAYEMHVGPVPPGLEICHNCGNRPCVNPRHLRADTHRANMGDCVGHETHTRGARNGRARLSAEAADEVRRLAAAGAQQKALARQFGVSPQAINHLLRGRTWVEGLAS